MIMNRAIKFIFAVCLTVGLAAVAAEKGKAQLDCPVRGGEIDKEVFVDFDGKRIYFCCPGCDTKFLKDAKANVAKMEKEGIKLAPAICPVSGEEADADLSAEHGGKTYYLCCKKCLKKFRADPAKYTGEKKSHGGHDHGKHKH
jgi:YHS domain-containing protein